MLHNSSVETCMYGLLNICRFYCCCLLNIELFEKENVDVKASTTMKPVSTNKVIGLSIHDIIMAHIRWSSACAGHPNCLRLGLHEMHRARE